MLNSVGEDFGVVTVATRSDYNGCDMRMQAKLFLTPAQLQELADHLAAIGFVGRGPDELEALQALADALAAQGIVGTAPAN